VSGSRARISLLITGLRAVAVATDTYTGTDIDAGRYAREISTCKF